MPPKPKFTREEIIDAAFEIVRSNGMEALASRVLGKKMGSSARPIFTIFKDMNELKNEVRSKAEDMLNEYLSRAENYEPLYKQAVKETIQFASDEPNLFYLIFMTDNGEAINFEFLKDKFKNEIAHYLDVLEKNYQLSEEESMIIFKHSSIYIYGVGAMCASRLCYFSDEQLNQLLGEVFMAMLMYIRSGKYKEKTPIPKELE